eukprot:CAMPEP_0183378876 /NCGR_PEP_ID=MMETSP0164_2-20130417/125140_1 /TAXON_ID=221442 /ORGANISM="Coccolithus pelagicus ssp braarudi, Strain PLY182g" /LENGTH=456 /DNA_ID=CAMNT_0025556449 /DNA_START=9 /DNA_END=1380 /DNA_ORIENTATION=-
MTGLLQALLVASAAAGRVGILGESGGDIQSCSEVESWTENFFVGSLLPDTIPEAVRKIIAKNAWKSSGNDTLAEYRAVGPDCDTRFRDISFLQTQAIAAQVGSLANISNVDAYGGWKFVYGPGCPVGVTVMDALARMQSAGVTDAFVFDQDILAYENIQTGVTNKQIRSYLAAHPEWDVTFYSLNGLTGQPGYFELLLAKLKQQIQFAYPLVPASDLCIVLPSQGVPLTSEAKPGSGVATLRGVFHDLLSALPQYNLTLVSVCFSSNCNRIQPYRLTSKSNSQATFNPHRAVRSKSEVGLLGCVCPCYPLRAQVFNNKGGEGFPPPQNKTAWSEPVDKVKIPEMAAMYSCSHVMVTPILEWPQVDYDVYVYQGIGTGDEPGYKTTFENAGKKYRGMPSWDQTNEDWTGQPPVAAVPSIAPELPAFVGRLIADVLSGGAGKYDLTIITGGSVGITRT